MQQQKKKPPGTTAVAKAATGKATALQKINIGRVADVGTLLAGALQCAKEMAAKPPVAIWGTRQTLHCARNHSVDEALKQIGWRQGAV